MDEIFKAYDIRGIYPENINSEIAFRIGRALADFLGVDTICVGRDMRISSPEIAKGVIDGIIEQGVNVVDLGLVSTDMVYFATGKYHYGGGVMITASHNPGEWNGMKICGKNATPFSKDSGLFDVRDKAKLYDFKDIKKRGIYSKKNILDEWIHFALSFVDIDKIKPFKIAIDAGNGMAGKIMKRFNEIVKKFNIIPMYFDLDGTFPNHLASPIEPENTVDLSKKVIDEDCDIGLAFDGDADRVFFVDDLGEVLSGTITTAMIAEMMLKKKPKSKIIYNAICGLIVPEIIHKNNGTAIKTRVGHSFIKAVMKQEKALFGGEHSGHYYFMDNYNADSALIATLIILELLSNKNIKLSQLKKNYSKYIASGEINSKVENIPQKLQDLKNKYNDAKNIEDLDGLSFFYDKYWFNVRPSNTEPLLRLNVEATDKNILNQKTQEIIGFIRNE